MPHRMLFIDDAHIESQREVKRKIRPADKHHVAVLEPDRPWECNSAYLYGTVLRDDGDGWRMWYQTYDQNARHQYAIAYATSDDLIHWQKPALGHYSWGYRTDTNMVFGGNRWAASPSVIDHGPQVDPERRFAMLYWDAAGPEIDARLADSSLAASERWKEVPHSQHGTCIAWSEDGFNWTPDEKNPILPFIKRDNDVTGLGDVLSCFWDECRGKYVQYSKAYRHEVGQDEYTPIRLCGYSESDDLRDWSDPVVILEPDSDDDPDAQFYGMTVTPYEGGYVGLLWVWRSDKETDTAWIELTYSRNGTDFVRVGDRAPFIPVGEAGQFDSGMLMGTTSNFVVDGDKIGVLYGGWDGPHWSQERTGAIGLATLPSDRFVGMNAGADGGVLTTVSTKLESETLTINADSVGGDIVVEVQCHGQVVRSVPFSGDLTSHEPRWDENGPLKPFVGKDVVLKFHIHNATLYSVGCG